jgi:hypothetical protein
MAEGGLDPEPEARATLPVRDYLDLVQWALEALPCAPVPCTCLFGTCLRCRVTRQVNPDGREGA